MVVLFGSEVGVVEWGWRFVWFCELRILFPRLSCQRLSSVPGVGGWAFMIGWLVESAWVMLVVTVVTCSMTV